MLKKLLKYDFKSVFKYWWIAALSSFVLSLVGGGCITILNSEKNLPQAIESIAIILLVIVVLGFVAFSFISVILVFVRFYKNFFTDEGYLTFTLPVKRAQLLNSKLMTTVATMLITSAVCVINALVMLFIGFADVVFTEEFWHDKLQTLYAIMDEIGFYLPIYILEVILLIILCVTFSSLFIFGCITFASIITKKAKVLAAIGIYYVANGIFSFCIQMFSLFGITSLANWLSVLPNGSVHTVGTLILLGIISFIAMLCALLYTLQYWMIDRKLNLN